ncbi:hypothetical protein H3M14_01155 [Latilactobacillus sakei]|uniref:gp58-like family protein n=1 Tax=Latilactobacillus sakei TaxID=1599 RepID=UPI0015F3FC64|nr:gp58-like family protein [Latilactobacillus sakei]QMU86628.1 hypothetical protein H3M14_01155 [Latilactobacillus sakei]
MLKVSDAFNSAFAAPDRELRARVTIGKTVYDSDDLTSINYDSGAMTGEQFSIGSTYMNSAKIIFSHLVEGLKQLDEVLVELGVLKPDGTVEYVKMGTFIVDDKIQMDRNNNTTTIECMDRMTMLGGTYVSKLTYPARIKDVAIEIANMAGVKANETSFARLSENKINQPTGYTYRDAIGLIAQFQMGFALFDRDGLLDIRTLQDNSFKIDPNQYFLKGLVKNETFFKLNGISCTVVTTSKDENGNETSKTTVLQSGSSSGAQIKLANNVMTQDVLDRMYEALKFTNYYPFSLNWNGNPAVEAGDWLTVEDLQGNEFKVPNMSYTLTYNGGLTTTSKADTSVSSPATYSYGGSMSNIVNEIGGREGAEGNHIYEGTEDQKPTLSKEGDLWYKHVGPDTEEWIYKDGKWEFLTSTKTANDAQKAADQASKEAGESKKQANMAVDGANDAVAKAGFANDTADQAKSDAATAGQQAKDALTSAGTAITDAQKALTNSSSAQADSAQARKDSATAAADAVTAKNDAATALTDAKKALTDSSSAMVDSTQARKDSATAIKDAADSLTSAKDALNKVGSLTTSVTSQFTTVDNELKSKVNQTDYDKLKGTVTSQQTEINQNASGIKLKADKSYADTINNSVVKNTSSVGLLNDQIALTVSKAELNNTLSSYATQTWTQSQIKSTADSINLSVVKVQNNLDNMTIGGSNFVRNGNLQFNEDNWRAWGTETAGATRNIQKAGSDWPANTVGLMKITRPSGAIADWGYAQDGISVTPSTEYTVSVETGTNQEMVIQHGNGADDPWAYTIIKPSAHKRAEYTFKTGPNTVTTNIYVGFNNNQSGTILVSRITMTAGNKAVDWTPNPQDYATATDYANLELTVKGMQTTVSSKADQSQITQLANQISLKADTTVLNELKGTVDKQGSEITLNTNSIKLKADQSSVNTLKGTVDKQGSAINVNTKAIALKANQSSVDTLTGRVSTAEGKITVQSGQIAQTVSKTELTSKLNGYATQTWTQGQIKTTADQINLSVTKVQTELNNTQVGGVNFLRNGNFEFGNANWRVWQPTPAPSGSSVTYNNAGADWSQNTKGVVKIVRPTGDSGSYGIAQDSVAVTPNTEYTLSFETATASAFTISIGNADGYPYTYKVVQPKVHVRYSYTFKTPATAKIANVYFGFSGATQSGTQWISRVMLTAGNKSMDWLPNPADYTSEVEFAALKVTVNSIQTTVSGKADKSQVTQLAGSITSAVQSIDKLNKEYTQVQQTITGIQTTVGNKADKSQITQLANQITSTIDNIGTQNYVYNPSFKNLSLTGWLNTTNWYVSDLDVSGYNGTYGAGINLTNAGTAGTNSFMYMGSKHVSHSAVGQTFYFTAYVKIYGETTAGSYFFLDFATHNDEFGSGRVEYRDSNQVTITNGTGKWLKLSGSFVPTKPHKYISLSLYFSAHGVSSAHVMFSRPMLSYVQDAPFSDQGVSASEITQLSNMINLRVQKGDVINQINISPESILIAGQKVHITGQTTIDNAVIKDAMIANVKADKITAGTINGANVNVINLNANNITTGTLKGANLSMNLNTGEILFQKGSIRSTDGKLNMRINDGSMSLTNSSGDGVYFKDGVMALTDSNFWTNQSHIKYGEISFDTSIFTGATSIVGAALRGNSGVIVGTSNFVPNLYLGPAMTSVKGGGIGVSKDRAYMASEGIASVVGGVSYESLWWTLQPAVMVGVGSSYTSGSIWQADTTKAGNGTFIEGHIVGLTSDSKEEIMKPSKTSDLALASDGTSGYVLSMSVYGRTYSSGAGMTVTPNGVLGRISSASKYKLAIGEISTLNDEAHQFLSVKPKQWFDKSESEALADTMTTGNTDYIDDVKALPHTGFIAEDLYTAGLDSYVIRGNDGSIESIQYDRLPVLHHELIRELFNRLDAAEMEIYKLKQEVINNAN